MDKEHEAIQRMRLAAKMSERYYKKPLLLCYSGGKDSEVILEIAKRADIPFEVRHSHTTADAPETVYHVREIFKKLENKGIRAEIIMPQYKGKRVCMWTLIPMLGVPTRLYRFCCKILKETGGLNRAIATGVRSKESVSRSKTKYAHTITGKGRKADTHIDFENAVELFENPNCRQFVEHDREFLNHCKAQGKTVFNPIIDWTDHDVWDFLESEHIEINPIYKNTGCLRCGCIGCPMAGKGRYKEFRLYPKYEQAYKMSFNNMLEARREKGLPCKWKSAQEVFDWWMEDKNIPGQMSIEDYIL